MLGFSLNEFFLTKSPTKTLNVYLSFMLKGNGSALCLSLSTCFTRYMYVSSSKVIAVLFMGCYVDIFRR